MNILIALAVVLIILSALNLGTLRQLSKFNKSKQEIKDDKYYELKYRIEFILASAVLVIAVGGYFGYNFTENISNKAKLLNNRLDTLNLKINAKKDTLYSYDAKTKGIKDTLEKVLKRIRLIAEKDIIKQDFYIVDNLSCPFNEKQQSVTYYFNQLTTISHQKLPNFDKPPILIVLPENAVDLTLVRVNKDYFKIGASWAVGDSNFVGDIAKFSIMLSKR